MSSLYVLVSFPGDGDSMSIVPSSWLQGDESYWPPYKQQDKVDKAVKCLEKPKKEWNLHKVRILGMYGKLQHRLLNVFYVMSSVTFGKRKSEMMLKTIPDTRTSS